MPDSELSRRPNGFGVTGAKNLLHIDEVPGTVEAENAIMWHRWADLWGWRVLEGTRLVLASCRSRVFNLG
jgi:hypothetical protein